MRSAFPIGELMLMLDFHQPACLQSWTREDPTSGRLRPLAHQFTASACKLPPLRKQWKTKETTTYTIISTT